MDSNNAANGRPSGTPWVMVRRSPASDAEALDFRGPSFPNLLFEQAYIHMLFDFSSDID